MASGILRRRVNFLPCLAIFFVEKTKVRVRAFGHRESGSIKKGKLGYLGAGLGHREGEGAANRQH